MTIRRSKWVSAAAAVASVDHRVQQLQAHKHAHHGAGGGHAHHNLDRRRAHHRARGDRNPLQAHVDLHHRR